MLDRTPEYSLFVIPSMVSWDEDRQRLQHNLGKALAKLAWKDAEVPEHRENNDTDKTSGSGESPGDAFSGLTGKLLASIASQTVMITALLFYFGWARVHATYGYFGIDVSVLKFSVADYVLRSVSTAIPSLIVIGLLITGALLIHYQLRSRLAHDSAFAGRLAQSLSVGGWIAAATGFLLAVSIKGLGGPGPLGPVVMTYGFAAIAYGLLVRGHYVVTEGASPVTIIIIGLFMLAFFWAVTVYANYVGIRTAMQLQAGLPTAANVSVYSSSNLSLTGPGIKGSVVHSNSIYRFRYSGLRLLVSSDGQYFLLPAEWRPGTGAVIVLPVSSSGIHMRVQFEARAS